METVCTYFGLSKREKGLLPKETKKIRKVLAGTPPTQSQDTHKEITIHCSNCDAWGEDDFIRDESSGDLVCSLCGFVYCERLMVSPNLSNDQTVDNPYFSEGSQFKSYWGKGHKRLKRINYYVDTHVKAADDFSKTSVTYKDDQRAEVYNTLKNMAEVTDFPPEVFQEVKRLFHCYRTQRSRIHKLDLTMVALFQLALEQSSYVESPELFCYES